MGTERESALLWLPGAFLLEVAAWELDTRLRLGLSDPTWEEFGRSIQVERIAWGLAAAIVVLSLGARLIRAGSAKVHVLMLQLLGTMGLLAFWVGGSAFGCGAVVVLSTLGAWATLRAHPRG